MENDSLARVILSPTEVQLGVGSRPTVSPRSRVIWSTETIESAFEIFNNRGGCRSGR